MCPKTLVYDKETSTKIFVGGDRCINKKLWACSTTYIDAIFPEKLENELHFMFGSTYRVEKVWFSHASPPKNRSHT